MLASMRMPPPPPRLTVEDAKEAQKLAGPRVYGTTLVEDVFMGEGRREATAADIVRALALYRTACLIEGFGLALLVMVA